MQMRKRKRNKKDTKIRRLSKNNSSWKSEDLSFGKIVKTAEINYSHSEARILRKEIITVTELKLQVEGNSNRRWSIKWNNTSFWIRLCYNRYNLPQKQKMREIATTIVLDSSSAVEFSQLEKKNAKSVEYLQTRFEIVNILVCGLMSFLL